MRHLIAIFPCSQAEAACDALYRAGLRDFVLTDVLRYMPGRQAHEIYKGAKYAVNTVPGVRLDVTVEDASAQTTIDLMLKVGSIARILNLPVDLATATANDLATYARSHFEDAPQSRLTA